MEYHTVLKKMQSDLNDEVNYFLVTDNDFLHLNQFAFG